MKTRNPVAGNAWKFNTPKVVPDKREKIERRFKQRRFHRVADFLEDC